MKERAILFSAPMVRAILEGRKTQTRRIMKPHPNKCTIHMRGDRTFQERFPAATKAEIKRHSGAFFTSHGPIDMRKPEKECEYSWHCCPFGNVGDRLWVKETAIIAPKNFARPDDSCIRDKNGDLRYVQYIASSPNTEAAEWYSLKKTPSIFMPRWASRITLEIIGVRVERLNEISEEDAQKEGLFRHSDGWLNFPIGEAYQTLDFRGAFRMLWESINGPGSWAKNPFVWVIEFKVI